MENKSTWTLFEQFGLYIIAKIKYSLCRWRREWDQSTVKRQLSDKNSNSKQSLKSDAEWVPRKMEASLLRQNHVLKAIFETISLFFSETFSWIYIQFFASDTKQICNDYWKFVHAQVLKIVWQFPISEIKPPCIETKTIANLNSGDLRTRNVDHTIFLTFHFFNSIEVRNYWAIFQWHITPNENLNNFKCNLKIRATSTGELGKLEW